MNIKKRALRTISRILPQANDLRALYWLFFRHKRLAVTCNCCGREVRLRLFGLPPRLNAICPHCQSLERHRLLRAYLDGAERGRALGSVLHFAPEPNVRDFVEPRSVRYVGCDLFPTGDLAKINIEAIDFPDGTFDTIVCSHVLEHVDDRKALAELFRVTKPGGLVLMMFPIIEGWDRTYENPAITDPAGRLRHFGQADHVRYFGRDVRDRIRSAGLELTEFTAEEPDVSRLGLLRGEKIFIGRRP